MDRGRGWRLATAFCVLAATAACAGQGSKASPPAGQNEPAISPSAAGLPGQQPGHSPATGAAGPKALSLQTMGEPRALPSRLLGASAEALIEHLVDDPRKVAIGKEMGLAFVRFPGGSQANYYDWRSGLLAFEVRPDSSAYTRFWAQAAPKIRQAFPNGISMDDYKPFADALGAEIVLVPNLETSTITDQVAWFESMKARGQLPPYIELGNEFWVAMAGDPNVMKKWPDALSATQVMKQYYESFKPLLPAGAKVAIQAVGSSYFFATSGSGAFGERLARWDKDLRPEPWFDAVTLHLYTRLDEVLGPTADPRAPRDAALNTRIFAATMARASDGVDRVLTETEKQLPGKEIWITEWNPRGASYANEYAPVTPSMYMQLTARMIMSYLRHPSVTMSLYFTLNFDETGIASIFLPDGRGGYAPTGTAIALRWFDEAANGGATYQRLGEKGATPVPGGGARAESYLEVEGALFRSGGRSTLLLQNASVQPRQVNLSELAQGALAPKIEVLAMPDLSDPVKSSPTVQTAAPSGSLTIPAYSLTRIIW